MSERTFYGVRTFLRLASSMDVSGLGLHDKVNVRVDARHAFGMVKAREGFMSLRVMFV